MGRKIFFQAILLLVFANLYAAAQRQQFNRIIENNGLKGQLNVHDPGND